jgi:uncharacterized cupin superfamily protein
MKAGHIKHNSGKEKIWVPEGKFRFIRKAVTGRRHIVSGKTNYVSEEHVASIFRVGD